MFSRIYSAFFFLFFVLPLMANASAIAGRQTSGNCNTGSIQCCNSVQSASNPVVGLLTGLLGIILPDLTALVGLTCSPLSILGLGSNSCSAQPVCCTGNNFSGLIVLGCSPINLGL